MQLQVVFECEVLGKKALYPFTKPKEEDLSMINPVPLNEATSVRLATVRDGRSLEPFPYALWFKLIGYPAVGTIIFLLSEISVLPHP